MAATRDPGTKFEPINVKPQGEGGERERPGAETSHRGKGEREKGRAPRRATGGRERERKAARRDDQTGSLMTTGTVLSSLKP